MDKCILLFVYNCIQLDYTKSMKIRDLKKKAPKTVVISFRIEEEIGLVLKANKIRVSKYLREAAKVLAKRLNR